MPGNFTIPILTYEGLHSFAELCKNQLLVDAPYEVIYPEGVRGNNESTWKNYVPQIKQQNNNLLSNLRNKANLYAIYRRTSENDKWELVYVGERKSEGMRERITQHLIDKDERTGSKLDEVKETVRAGGHIGVSFLLVRPESLRLYIEEYIIGNMKPLIWNVHGKA